MNLAEEAQAWVDTKLYAQDIVDRFTQYVNDTHGLNKHRTFVEQKGYGFGERAFHWAWKLLVDEMPDGFRFLEIGVFKGQVISLIRLLADMQEKHAIINGVTPLSTTSGPQGKFSKFPESDYAQDIANLHHAFGLAQPQILNRDSTDGISHWLVGKIPKFDIVYIDGCHEFDSVLSDIKFYSERVKPGGYLVMDDSANNLKEPWGFFQGIVDVSTAVMLTLDTDPQWKHLIAVMHLRVFQREG